MLLHLEAFNLYISISILCSKILVPVVIQLSFAYL